MDIGERLKQELAKTTARLTQLDELSIVRGEGSVRPVADPMEEVRVAVDREMEFATRSRLVERAHRLAEALDLLAAGEYGVCEECGEAIAAARLEWMPEVRTCVRCQARRERLAHVGWEGEEKEEIGEDEELL